MRKVYLLTLILILAMVTPALAAPLPPLDTTPSAPEGDSTSLRPSVSQADLLADYDATANYLEQWASTADQRPPVDPVAQSQTTAQWTVLVHVAADNNLEVAGLSDINEMEAIGSSADVNIIAQIDRSADYVDYDGDWTEARRYYIQQDEDPRKITSPILDHLGEVDSGDADVLADFLIWGITNYPAEKYMVILWDHGGAWISHSSDEDTGSDMNMPEFVAALDRVQTETGVDKFEVIGFDMCLMAQFEVSQSIEPYANFTIGSEENEPGAGWFYLFLDELVKDPSMNGDQVGRQVVDYFMYFLQEVVGDEDVYGLGVMDLSQSAQMLDALNTFSTTVSQNPPAFLSDIADARNNTISYGGFSDPQVQDIFSSIDLYQFADLLTQLSPDPDLTSAAEGIKTAINDFVIYEDHVKALDGSHGVSIYFPRTQKAYQFAGFHKRYPVEIASSLDSWVQFLSIFHGTAEDVVREAPGVNITGVYPEVANIYNPAIVSMEVTGRDILRVNYVVSLIRSADNRIALDFDYLISRTTTTTGADIVDWSDGVTERTFAWGAEVPQLTDGTTSTFALLIPNLDNPDMALVNGMYAAASGGEPIEAQLLFDLNARRSTALWGLNQTASGNYQPFEIQVEPGSIFQPVLLTLDENNEISDSSLGDQLRLQAADSITFEQVPAPSGEYAISFVAENVSGINNLSEAIIQVNNEGLDPAYRGYTDLTYGVNFLYPAHWLRPRFLPDGKRLYTGLEEAHTVMSLYPYTDVTSAEETDARIRDSWSDLKDLQIGEQRALEINGLPAYYTEYTYTYESRTGDEPHIGIVIAIYVPAQGVGYGFDIDAPAAAPEEAEIAVPVLAESINFFETAQAAGQSAWQTITSPDGQISFPIPANWTEDPLEGWSLYGPVDNDDVFVALSSRSATGSTNQELAEYWVGQLQASVSNLELSASEPFYIGGREWYVVVFEFDGETARQAGAFFTVTNIAERDFVFWIQAPDAIFDQLYADIFSVIVGGFTINE